MLDGERVGHYIGGRFHPKGGRRTGQTIIKATFETGGLWTGTLLWRNTEGEARWQPIKLRRVGSKLHGTSENEHCYEYMPRAK